MTSWEMLKTWLEAEAERMGQLGEDNRHGAYLNVIDKMNELGVENGRFSVLHPKRRGNAKKATT